MSASLDPYVVRHDFPILERSVHETKKLVYFDNAATTQHPQSVIKAIGECYESQYSNVHRGIHALSEESTALYEKSRGLVQSFIGASVPEEIIFTSGTTAAINIVARSLGDQIVSSGDEILLTIMEHHSNIVPWQQLAERTGAKVVFAPIDSDGLLDLEAFKGLLNERTKIVGITAVSNVLGTINPIEKVCQLAHQFDARVVVDAAQAVPHEVVNVQKWDADFVTFSGHKMLGPSGIGILFGKRDLLESMPPFLGGGSMINSVTVDGYVTGELPAKFEAGTPPIAQAVGMIAAIEYLNKLGLDEILDHERDLNRRAHEILVGIEGVHVLGPDPEIKAGISSFYVEGISAQDVTQLIDLQGVALRAGHHCAMPLHKHFGIPNSNRASFYIYNTLEEVEFFGESLKKVLGKLR